MAAKIEAKPAALTTDERLARIEANQAAILARLDAVLAFTGTLQGLLGAYLSGGAGKLLGALSKVRGR